MNSRYTVRYACRVAVCMLHARHSVAQKKQRKINERKWQRKEANEKLKHLCAVNEVQVEKY